jgi:hypothetical protein
VNQEQRQVHLAGDAADVEICRRPPDAGLDRGNEGGGAATRQTHGLGEEF